MTLVQKLKGNQKTFSEIANNPLAYVISEGCNSQRISVVFDVYRKDSIKNTERMKRGAKEGTQFKNLVPGHKVQQWRKFCQALLTKQA